MSPAFQASSPKTFKPALGSDFRLTGDMCRARAWFPPLLPGFRRSIPIVIHTGLVGKGVQSPLGLGGSLAMHVLAEIMLDRPAGIQTLHPR